MDNSELTPDKLVAPLVGAWIEIYMVEVQTTPHHVAPLVGAWIEIVVSEHKEKNNYVAPLVGAWIEIYLPAALRRSFLSLLSWERGLKYKR